MSMNVIENRGEGVKDYNLERVIMLSDGVFAIAITLLTLELRPPPRWDATFPGLWLAMWRPFLAYVVSFAVIAVYWLSHRRIFSRFARIDTPLTLLNFFFLALVGLVPAATNLIYVAQANRTALLLYIGLMGAIGVAAGLTFGYGAFLGGSIVKVQMPLRRRISIFLSLVFVPVLASAGSIVASEPGRQWLFAVMAAVWLAGRLIVRTIDRRGATQRNDPPG